MFPDNLMRGRQPESGSVAGAIGMFGAEKGIKNMFEVVGCDTASFVLDLQLHTGRPARLRQEARLNPNDSIAVRHRIQSIQQQIQQDLFDLLTIKRKRRELR